MQSQNPNFYNHYKRLTRWNANRCYSLRTTYLIFETFQIFFQQLHWFLQLWRFSTNDIPERSIKLRIGNGGWHETLNLLHVSRCEMLHFVTSYMKQNKSRKQTLETAQYGLEISFKLCVWLRWSAMSSNSNSILFTSIWKANLFVTIVSDPCYFQGQNTNKRFTAGM